MLEVKVEQGTKEWKNLRLGKITGTRLKGIRSSNNLPIIDEMISELVVGEAEFIFINDAMKRGNEKEPEARALYIEKTGADIEEVGFCISIDNDYIWLSPDGFTKDRKGAIEIKCPSTKKHVQNIRMDKIPSEYKDQVLMYFILNEELEWLDFISYDDRFTAKPIWIKKVIREELEDEIKSAINDIDKFIVKFEKYYKSVLSEN